MNQHKNCRVVDSTLPSLRIRIFLGQLIPWSLRLFYFTSTTVEAIVHLTYLGDFSYYSSWEYFKIVFNLVFLKIYPQWGISNLDVIFGTEKRVTPFSCSRKRDFARVHSLSPFVFLYWIKPSCFPPNVVKHLKESIFEMIFFLIPNITLFSLVSHTASLFVFYQYQHHHLNLSLTSLWSFLHALLYFLTHLVFYSFSPFSLFLLITTSNLCYIFQINWIAIILNSCSLINSIKLSTIELTSLWIATLENEQAKKMFEMSIILFF